MRGNKKKKRKKKGKKREKELAMQRLKIEKF